MSEMTCKQLVELVTSYLDGSLEPASVAELERHLVKCPGCGAYLAQFRETIDALGELPVSSISPKAEEAIMGTFRSWHAGHEP